MDVISAPLPGVLIITPRAFSDPRGSFFESWHRERYASAGIAEEFLQDNVSRSVRGVLRGLHFQHPEGQGKLVSVLEGEVFDVVVDVRRGSPHFGKSFEVQLGDSDHRQLYVPPGFAHGFQVLTASALFAYKCTRYYRPDAEHTVAWDDPALAIRWPIADAQLSEKDRKGTRLADLPADRLPSYQ